MYRFHVCLHALGSGVSTGTAVEIEGITATSLAVAPESLSVPLGLCFEEASAALSALPRMFCEPDGSFVWVSESAHDRWQVEGCLFDRGGALLFVEIWGTCPVEKFDNLLGAFGWPKEQFAFQLVRQAIFLDEREFRRVAGEGVALRPAKP